MRMVFRVFMPGRAVSFACLFVAFSAWGNEPGHRWLGIEGVANARDAGGYPAKDGSHVRWGSFLRANQLGTLSEKGLERFRELRIRTVVDFRMDYQVAAFPEIDSVSGTAAYYHFPIGIDGSSYEEIYLNIVDVYALSLKQAFELLADPENLPFLCHCSAGKDRTGLFVALVHRLLGVSDEDIMSDYLLSLEINYYVHPDWLQVVLNRVDEEGGIGMFLTNRGVDGDIQQAIQANLLDRTSSVLQWDLY